MPTAWHPDTSKAVPPWNAIAGEMSPSWSRVEVAAMAMILFCVGVSYTVGALTVWRSEAVVCAGPWSGVS